MKRIQINDLHLWQFNSLKEEPSVKHFVTDRASNEAVMRKSLSRLEEEVFFTLSYSSSPDKEQIRANRNLLATALGVAGEQLFIPSQIHETRIGIVSSSTSKEELLNTDALITNEKGICIAVLAADCVPILLYDRKNKAVGAVHSGWRGTVDRILQKTLQEMQSLYGTTGQDLIACIGPSVCQESYEVGEEVVNRVKGSFERANELMIPKPDNKAKLDLWKANKMQLLDFGVDEAHIEISGLCTVKENQHFFSARKGDAGRFAAGIMLV